MLLLIFGVVAGVACTDAIMSAVQEEAEVVQLAQQLVAQKVVVQEANRCAA
jgi:sodium-coupled neutral amino acid transporter 10